MRVQNFFFIKVSWFHYFPFYLVSLNFIGFSRFFDALCIPYIQFEDSEETEIVETRPKPIIDVCCNKGNTARSTMHSGVKKEKIVKKIMCVFKGLQDWYLKGLKINIFQNLF